MLQLGMTPLDMLLGAVGSKDDPSSGGRQMPSHWSHPRLNVVTRRPHRHPVPAGGRLRGGRPLPRRGPRRRSRPRPASRRTRSSTAPPETATTSEGEFWESLNTACNLKLPVLYLIEDNGYAISVPVEVQTAGGSISRLVRSFPNLLVREVDGCDPVASLAVLGEAAAWCRARQGPALVHARVIRPYSHSLSDDEALYRCGERARGRRAARPARPSSRSGCSTRVCATAEQLAAIRDEVERDGERRGRRRPRRAGARARRPRPGTSTRRRRPDGGRVRDRARCPAGDPKTMVDLLNACLHDEMARDPRHRRLRPGRGRLLARGRASREVKGKGGVFKVTHNLQRQHGSHRVYNTPLAEANIVGRAIGMATRGLKPVVEIQFFDYIWPAYMQIRNELALIRWRSNGAFKCPVVIRVTYGGYLQGGAVYHSQCGEVDLHPHARGCAS